VCGANRVAFYHLPSAVVAFVAAHVDASSSDARDARRASRAHVSRSRRLVVARPRAPLYDAASNIFAAARLCAFSSLTRTTCVGTNAHTHRVSLRARLSHRSSRAVPFSRASPIIG